MEFSRRDFLRTGLPAIGFVAVNGANASAIGGDVPLGCQTYSFHDITQGGAEAIDRILQQMKRIGLDTGELFSPDLEPFPLPWFSVEPWAPKAPKGSGPSGNVTAAVARNRLDARTGYARGCLGKFDPKTSADTEWASPGGPQSAPYGISLAKGEIWYSEAGVRPNTLVRFNPRTLKFQSWEIPSGGKVIRNLVTTRDQELLLACSGVNGLALAKVGESSESMSRPSHSAPELHGAFSQKNFLHSVH